MSQSKNTFAELMSIEEFAGAEGIALKDIKVAVTNNGSTLLVAHGKPIATIQNDLKGSNLTATVQKIASVNLMVGIPHVGSKDNAGRDSLPCLMESKSTWEVANLF